MGTGEADDDLLPTLLAICEDFLANASPLVHREHASAVSCIAVAVRS